MITCEVSAIPGENRAQATIRFGVEHCTRDGRVTLPTSTQGIADLLGRLSALTVDAVTENCLRRVYAAVDVGRMGNISYSSGPNGGSGGPRVQLEIEFFSPVEANLSLPQRRPRVQLQTFGNHVGIVDSGSYESASEPYDFTPQSVLDYEEQREEAEAEEREEYRRAGRRDFAGALTGGGVSWTIEASSDNVIVSSVFPMHLWRALNPDVTRPLPYEPPDVAELLAILDHHVSATAVRESIQRARTAVVAGGLISVNYEADNYVSDLGPDIIMTLQYRPLEGQMGMDFAPAGRADMAGIATFASGGIVPNTSVVRPLGLDAGFPLSAEMAATIADGAITRAHINGSMRIDGHGIEIFDSSGRSRVTLGVINSEGGAQAQDAWAAAARLRDVIASSRPGEWVQAKAPEPKERKMITPFNRKLRLKK